MYGCSSPDCQLLHLKRWKWNCKKLIINYKTSFPLIKTRTWRLTCYSMCKIIHGTPLISALHRYVIETKRKPKQ